MATVKPQLKNIRFANISVMILSIEHVSRVLIRWKLEPTAQDLRNIKFYLDSGESPTAFRQLNGEGLSSRGLYEYVDETANLIDVNKVLYYRVRAVEESPDGLALQTFTSQEMTWDGGLDLVGLYVAEEHLFEMRWVDGVPSMIFKKIHDGTYCPECWDNILKRVTKSNCTVCYGTGRLGGYYPPIDAWMKFEPDPKMEQVVEWGKRQASQTDIVFTNYPLLSPDDIIVELKSNRFWKVENVRYPEKNRTILLQMARLNAVSLTDIEYKITVPEDRRRLLVDQMESREREREF